MSVNYSKKQLILTLLGGFFCAAGIAFLANFILAGPKLGFHYDFLQSFSSPSAAAGELVIIDTGDYFDTSDVSLVLITLTEMEAKNLILTGRLSPSSSPVTITEAEIRQRFVDEYILLDANIRNLFEAIRSGSVSPVQAPEYTRRLLELAEQGRDRLLTALINRDEDLSRSISVFGGFMEAPSPPEFDRDGKLRRVPPTRSEFAIEHPVFTSLKNRYEDCQIEKTDRGYVLWIKKFDGEEKDIALDKKGNIIAGLPDDIRRVDISLFREYDEANRAVRNALQASSELGALSRTLPEKSPLFLFDYSLELREETLKSPDSGKKEAWILSRLRFLESLDAFLDGEAEAELVSGYNDVIASETSLPRDGVKALEKMRDDLIQVFAFTREKRDALKTIRDKLSEDFALSFCVMGSSGYADYSAALANVMITNYHVIPSDDKTALIWSIAAAFIILLLVFSLSPFTELICGVCLSVIAFAGFSLYFIFNSYWIDPFIVFSSSLSGTLVIYCVKRAILTHRTRRFRSAYGAAVSDDTLKKLIIAGKPFPSEVNVAKAAVVAVKDIFLMNNEDREKPLESGDYKKVFFASIKEAAFAFDAVIGGFDPDTVLVCFGSPLLKAANPLKDALLFVREIAGSHKGNWCFGIDFGMCSFSWTLEAGFQANGRPAVRARILASQAAVAKKRVFVTSAVSERLKGQLEKSGALFDSNEPVYDFSPR